MFSNASIKEDNFIQDFLFSTYILFILFTTATYFTTLLGRTEISKLPLILYGLVLLLVTLMYMSPDSVFVIWQFALAAFIIQVSQSIFSLIQQKNLLSTIAKISLFAATGIALLVTFFKPESMTLYSVLYLAIVSSGILVAINFIIPSKQVNQ